MAKYVVAKIGEIAEGGRKIVELNGRSVGVFHVNGAYYALRNRCPHQGGNLCEGPLSGFVMAKVPGQYEYSRKGEILRCPWHGWEFDVTTGQSWCDPTHMRVRLYDVHVEKGAQIEKGGDMAGLVKGPYVAEMFPVTVEDEYVVVEL